MVNPTIVHRRAGGGVVFGLTAALFGEIQTSRSATCGSGTSMTIGMVRMHESPEIEVYVVDGTEKPGVVGEPATALVAPAVCNAIYAATRKRIRALPIAKQGFVHLQVR